ncbi:S9 family peptidase [Brevibacterium linens]|uniref:S9 family peptidase n=1 Tax=Brevibacterium linens TaxID=1703 RepID=UPI000FCBD012|nr:S9 family peptidase [Brevibacterium linens]AZT99725.1 oligopeptidase B [Brevibacterium linens]
MTDADSPATVPSAQTPSGAAVGTKSETGTSTATTPASAPVAKKVPFERTHHGHTFIDDYEWMRQKESPEVIAHLEAENAWTSAQTAHLEGLRDSIFTEIKTRIKETDMSVPNRRGNYWYFSRTKAGLDYGISVRIPISGPDDWTPPEVGEEPLPGEEVVFDSNIAAAGQEFFSLGSFSLSDDGSRLLYGVDTTGDERYTLRLRDLAAGDDLADTIEGTFAGASLDPSGRFVFYTTVDDAWRPEKVWRHVVGTDSSDDVCIFHEPDERFFVGSGFSRSGRMMFVVTGSKTTTGYWGVSVDDLEAEPQEIWPRVDGVEYTVEHAVIGGEDRFLITHNRNRADFELVDVPAADPTAPGRDVIVTEAAGGSGELRNGELRSGETHNGELRVDDLRIEDVDAFADFIVLSYRRGGFARVGIIRLGDASSPFGPLQELPFDRETGTLSLGGNPEFAQTSVRLHFTSMSTPAVLYSHSVADGTDTVLKRQPVLGSVDLDAYSETLLWAKAGDGTDIPISVVFRKDLHQSDEHDEHGQHDDPASPEGAADGVGAAEANGNAASAKPLLLYGYGSYEASMDPYFSVSRLSLLDRGVVFAIAHVRGGGEMGRYWYDQGKTTAKKNTFTDFIDVARHLIDTGWTSPDRLVASGGSAGGLLMGAIANMAPELFAGISADVPFVDALTSILMPELPLTVIEWEEWGDPLHDPEVYEYMRSYSPYENVTEAAYPQILAVTSLNDTRVLYVEPAKWVARLREVGANALLKTEMVAGHGGASGRYDAWKEIAFEYAWILDVLGRSDVETEA